MKNGTISIGKVFWGNFEPLFYNIILLWGPKKALIIKVVYTMLFFVYVSYCIELGDILYVIYGAHHCHRCSYAPIHSSTALYTPVRPNFTPLCSSNLL